MASRRQRFKAVVNIPVRRGKNDLPASEESNFHDSSALEQGKVREISSVQESIDEASIEHSEKVDLNLLNAAHICNEGSRTSESRDENDIPLDNVCDNVGEDPIQRPSPLKTFSRKRLKPSVNLTSVVRKPKENTNVDVDAREVSSNDRKSDLHSSVSGIYRLPINNSSLNLSDNSAKDLRGSSSTSPSSQITDAADDTSSILQNVQNSSTETLDQINKSSVPVRPKFVKPTPRLVDASSRRNSQTTSTDPDDVQKQPEFARPRLPSIKTATTPDLSLTGKEITPSLADDRLTPVSTQPWSSADVGTLPTALTHPSEDTSDIETTCKETRSEKRTTHRRLRKNGAVEMLSRARRDFQNKFGDKTPEKDKLRMFDFIFYNPSTNPMKISEDTDNLKKDKLEVEDTVAERLAEESVDDVAKIEEEDDKPMPAPQVKVGPDGSLIIDEKSLVIETTGSRKRKDDLANSAVVVDYGLGNATYNSFSNKVKAKDWSKAETFKFYRALHSIGTDFLLMQSIFPNRTRKDLKQKFKKEDRLNRNLVDKALRYPLQFDLTQLEEDIAKEELEEKERVQASKKEKELAKSLALADKKFKGKRPSVLAKANLEDTGPKYPKRRFQRKKGTRKESDTNVDITETNVTKPQLEKRKLALSTRLKSKSTKRKKSKDVASNDESSTSCSSDEFDMYAENELTSDIVQSHLDEADNIDASPSESMAARKLEFPRVLSTADDIDVSSTDDEEVFLKKTVQTRYGRIPLRRVRSNSSEDEDMLEEQQLLDLNASSESSEACSSPVPDASVSLEHPDLSNVEPGSLVILTTPGKKTFKLFMVGPKGNGSTENKISHIPVTITPEMFATLSANNLVAGNAVIPVGDCTESLEEVEEPASSTENAE